MKDKQRKKAQRKINKHVEALNKNLLNDNLWRGRFFIRQTDANWERFEDGSGGLLRVWLEIRDKKSGVFKGFEFDNFDYGWGLFEPVNNFIIQDTDVWAKINEVKADKTDWQKKKWYPIKEVF